MKKLLVLVLVTISGCTSSLTLTTTPVDTYQQDVKYTQKCGGLKAWFSGCPQQPRDVEGS